MYWEIGKSKNNKPQLKKNFNLKTPEEFKMRGQWVQIGMAAAEDVVHSVNANRKQGYLVLLDEEGYYRALVLLD